VPDARSKASTCGRRCHGAALLTVVDRPQCTRRVACRRTGRSGNGGPPGGRTQTKDFGQLLWSFVPGRQRLAVLVAEVHPPRVVNRCWGKIERIRRLHPSLDSLDAHTVGQISGNEQASSTAPPHPGERDDAVPVLST
jgi:hypothetical protein